MSTPSPVIFLILLVVIILVFIGVRRILFPSQKQVADKTQSLEEVTRYYPELADIASEAKQNGASHFDYTGPAIFFYRNHDGTIERCFAEFLPGAKCYVWVWPPSNWHTDAGEIPERASPIPDSF